MAMHDATSSSATTFVHKLMHPVHRIAFIYAVSITYRLRYYFAWAVSESSLIFSGLSFNGYDDSTGRAQ
jgi:hypothetical protein